MSQKVYCATGSI